MAQDDTATREALATLADLARGDSGGSSGARSVLLYAIDTTRPITDFAGLSGRHRSAAVIILDRAWTIDPDLIRSIVPEISRWMNDQ